ncbi:HlyD family efflux transporter periplasmic adaptor subunit [Aggregicoccus sp. 17bor-14]|uniref:HlyD family secretion protein n=1 Tax=Myxococcaceae TaxID=31 RepID=UPI00129CD437|nr:MULTISPECIES: efflux RND transporter periplasmic adaptor subunit [Myxococcaceae]MBF5041609.1 efflux RND transporter periplasmic adaptor subunit [Simulacricoccus sp. 17bor-14]MRI87394.1 HlyD family efflux transporter periplasmic adaptor subunit [Aggregicoccus sp. 17bor-14]
MRRVAVALVALTLVLSGLIALRLWKQARAEAAPAGGSGEIEGVRVDLSSRVGARIAALHVREGERVHKGQLLVTLDCSDAEAQLAAAQAKLAAGRAQQEAAAVQVVSARSNTSASRAAQAAALAQAEATGAQRDAAERQAARLASIPTVMTVATVDQTKADADALSHRARAARAQANASAEQARAAASAVRAADAQSTAAAAMVHAAEAEVARARLMADECAVHAPRDAEVAELPHEAGELVSPGAVLARLVDLSEVKATFYLPNAEVGAVKPGAEAQVVADAFPRETFRAHVRTVALEAEFTPRNIQTRTDRDRLVYAVEVRVDNPGGRLRDGMPVQVTLPGTGR